MFGRLTFDALPLYSAVAFGGAAITVARRPGGGGGDHVVRVVAHAVDRVADQRRSQAHRHHVCDAGADHAAPRLRRCPHDARPAGDRAQLRRLPAARAFRPDLLLARHHHDLLHGDAVPDRPDQHRRAAADRRARRRLPSSQRGQPVADGRRRRAGDGVAGHRQVLDRRLERLSAVFGDRLQPRRRRRLLGVGGAHLRYRLDADRHQLHRHHPEEARARHDPHANAAVRVDDAVHGGADGLRLSRRSPSSPRCSNSTACSACTSSPMATAAT